MNTNNSTKEEAVIIPEQKLNYSRPKIIFVRNRPFAILNIKSNPVPGRYMDSSFPKGRGELSSSHVIRC